MRVYLHVGLWCALLAIFIALTIPTVGPAVLENKIDPNHSTDSYLSGLTHVRNGSALFTKLIETVPRDKSIVIFVDAGNSPSEFLGMLVAYLSWPRDVQMVRGSPSTYARELAAINTASVGAVVFCDLNPPNWMQRATHFGSRITFLSADLIKPNR